MARALAPTGDPAGKFLPVSGYAGRQRAIVGSHAHLHDWPLPPRWRGTRDFGPSKFGRYPGDPDPYTGRRVDLLGRSLPELPASDPADAIRRYLVAAVLGPGFTLPD